LRCGPAGHAERAGGRPAGTLGAGTGPGAADGSGPGRPLLDADARVPASGPADARAPGPAVERGAQHPSPDRLAGARVFRSDPVQVAPCWTLMLAFPQAVQPTLAHLGPQWNAALSTHHRIAWLARESSKPGRGAVERWTVQASAAWSQEHLEDDGPRVQAKLLKAFGEVTGIYAEPSYAQVHRWRWARTEAPLGRPHLWDSKEALGVCGDWCLGHRVEDAFISGLELALAVHGD